MKSTGIVRPIDSLGRVVLPIELRKTLNLNNKDLLEIFLDDDSIILKKCQKSCIFCKSKKELSGFSGKYICEKCLKNVKDM